MARRVKPSPEAIREQNVRAWRTMRQGSEGYAGFRPCTKCGQVSYCRGKYYDRQKCFECFVTP